MQRVVIVLLCSLTSFHVAARQCGFPGQPHYSVIKPRKEVYDESELVTYTCQNNYYVKEGSHFVKEFKRKCQCHGLWDGALPTCNYYDFVMKRSLKFSGHVTDLAKIIDDNEETCGKLVFPNTTTTGKLYLKLFTATNYVQAGTYEFYLRLKPISSLNGIAVSVNQNINGNWIACSNNVSLSHTETIVVPCKYNTGPQSLEIQYYLPQNSQELEIPVCSLKVLATTSTGCGLPQRPANGIAIENGLNITYRCKEGYKLRGNSQSSCQWTGNNKFWVSNPFPICISDKERECGTLPEITNGRLHFTRQACLHDYNVHELFNVAILQCNPGYTIRIPDNVAYCNESTNWTWKFNLSPIPQEKECVTLENSAYLPLTIIGILLTIFNVLYCCYLCYRSKFSLTMATPRLEEMQNCENMVLAKDSQGQAENYLPRYTMVRHEEKTRDPCSEDSSATYAEIAVRSSSASTGIQHYLKNNAMYAKVMKSQSMEKQKLSVDLRSETKMTEDLYILPVDIEAEACCIATQTETLVNNIIDSSQVNERLEHNYAEKDYSTESEPLYNEIYYSE